MSNLKIISIKVLERSIMTQDEKWQARYEEIVEFINRNHRNPSKHRIEEHDMLNWILCCI